MPELSLQFPVLLGPVRVETRFTATELLVRVFPDEWVVDKFEPRPTEAEVAALDAYWTALWASGGSPVGEQAAWHELVARVPVGRAAWLLQGHQPANPADRPLTVPAGTTVLVVVSPQPPVTKDRQAATTYWTAVWRAHGDRVKLRAAEIALLAAAGATSAAAIRGRRPSGVDSATTNPDDAVTVAFLVLTPLAANQLAPQSWTVAAKASLLPDAFTVFGYVGDTQVFSKTGSAVRTGLAVSPDPNEPTQSQLKVDETTGVLTMPTALRWLTDFTEAVAAGMGIRIPLQDGFRHGVDRLVVLGLRQQATPAQSATAFAGLLTNQLRSPAGLALLPQGTATNNSEQTQAGTDPVADADTALGSAAGFAATAPDWRTKTDGQWFAELLGIDPAVLTGAPNAQGTDRRDARAAHTALWPATWGHYLPALLNGVLTDEQVAQTREFFLEHVSGRGPLPTLKIGRQPYGIVATTVFSRLTWPDPATSRTKHRTALHKVLTEAAKNWHTAMLQHVTHLDGPGDDPHQKLLDILALHPTSAEYHHRYAQSVEDVFNRENLRALGPTMKNALEQQLNMPAPIRALLAALGRPTSDPALDPDVLRRLFTDVHHPLLAPLVDDRPLSEVDLVRGYTDDGRNYLDWLALFGRTDLDKVREEAGFADGRPPAALLYLLARHAVLLGWAETARRLAVTTPGDEVPDERDAPFIHVRLATAQHPIPSESRYRKLYSADPAMTGDPSRLVHEHIRTLLAGTPADPAVTELTQQLDALDMLATLPTARLERVFAEHVDCATYRLDAWRLGLATERLSELRFGPDGTATPTQGLHLGAYGWLENIAANTAALDTVAVPSDLTAVFGATAIPHDSRNGGYVHAPSPAHARTAAVLRAGYLANGSPDNANSFAVNLSSGRVRVALSILDGMRQGQSLGALLGYRFERGLHDRDAGLDPLIAGLRLKFPLRAGKIAETAAQPGDAAQQPERIDQVEARNVIDGLALFRHVNALRADGQPDTYPFGFPDLVEATPAQVAAVAAEVGALREVHDALADLAVAEGTHQALLGNTERASTTLDAFAKDAVAPEPAVVETPRSGTTLTHRLAVQFTPGLDPDHGAPLLGHNNPRARAEPAVNDWLPAVLPKATDVAAQVSWTDPDGHPQVRVVTQQQAGLQPIDMLWALRPTDQAAMTDLDDRILGVVVTQASPRPDVALSIDYTTRVSGKVSFFELSPVVDAVRSLLTTSRPLRSNDLVPAAGSAPVDPAADDAVSLPRARPAAVLDSLGDLVDDFAKFVTDLGALYPAGAGPVRAGVLSGIDTFLTRYAGLTVTAGGFGLVRSSWGELLVWRKGVFAGVLAAVATIATRMSTALAAADALFTQYDHLPASTPESDKLRLVRQAERLITTKPDIGPGDSKALRNRLKAVRNDFAAKASGLASEATTTKKTLSALLTEVATKVPPTEYDAAGLDLTPFQDQVVAFGADLLARAQKVKEELDTRSAGAVTALAAYDAAVTGPDKVRAGVDALKALLGDDVLAVPEFTPPSAVIQQWRKARTDSDKLVAHLVPARDFPVDDWLHGMARVRDKARLWEKTVLMADALLGAGGLLGIGAWQEPTLSPVQLPFVTNDHWLAMEFAAGGTPLDDDRLLFTAHYATTLNSNNQCGLVFDEWTEVIPADRETTGIAVHFDRPDTEPPQAMLLVAPPVLDPAGHWSPGDLVDAIAETFELAKLRAVEPEHLDGTAYAHLLPATVLSATRQQITISTDLALANLRWKADR